jgi:gamma-glutamylputrescine oxidase
VPGYAGDGAYPGSYYAASANPVPERPPLRGEIAPEVLIVGAGFTGLSAGIELAERGHEVVVVEGAKVGWGASGRNGGQIVNGLNASLGTIEARYGRWVADFVATVVQEGGALIRERVRRYGIDCDLKDGNIFTAFTARQMTELEEKQALWRGHGIDSFEMLDRAALRRHVASEIYLGGMLDRSGGHMHPLNLALGEAAVGRMVAAGYAPVMSFNPYWDRNGVTFEDPDGYRVVLQQGSWDA